MDEKAPDSTHKKESRKIRPWVFVCLVLLAAGLTAAAFAVFGDHRIEGNAGVVALYDFVCTYEQNTKEITQGRPATLIQRLRDEPFEIIVDLESKNINIMGLPLPRVTAGVEAKYDLYDFGLRAKAFWLEWGLFLLGQDVVIDTGEAAQAATLPEAGLGDKMPLGERTGKLVPKLPEDGAAQKRLFEALAQSVPEQATQTEQADFSSPMDGQHMQAQAVVTRLDAAALEHTAAALLARMQADAALGADVQAMYAPLALYFGGGDDAASALARLAEGADEDASLEWTVYWRGERYVGYSCVMQAGGKSVAWSASAEFSGKAVYERVTLAADGEAYAFDYAVDHEKGTLQGGLAAPDVWLEVSGTFALDQYTSDAYVIDAQLVLSADAMGIVLRDAPVTARADIRCGAGLEPLAQSRGWREIYDKQREEMHPDKLLPFGAFWP